MGERSRGVLGFLYLWFVLLFSYTLIKLAFQLLVLGYIEWRVAVLQELFWLPLGQSLVFWLITRRSRAPHG